MADTAPSPGARSVHISGNAANNVMVTGDGNTVAATYQQAALPAPERVDIRAELAALREALSQVQSPESRKIANALSDAEDEVGRPQPAKAEVGQALQRALGYAQQAEGFTQTLDKLKTPVANIAAWLGANWHSLLPLVGLSSA